MNKSSGRSRRTEEEDRPSLDYLERIASGGPRVKESLLSFHKRLGAIEAARKLVEEKFIEVRGNKIALALLLGVSRNNLAYELRLIGLSDALLKEKVFSQKES